MSYRSGTEETRQTVDNLAGTTLYRRHVWKDTFHSVNMLAIADGERPETLGLKKHY